MDLKTTNKYNQDKDSIAHQQQHNKQDDSNTELPDIETVKAMQELSRIIYGW